jgi:NTE family protein
LQVGALRALLEAGLRPDLLVGTSVGAVNAVHLAVRGFTRESLDAVEDAWRDAAGADLLPGKLRWVTIRALFRRTGSAGERRLRAFFVKHGLQPGLRFGQIEGPPLIVVATDLEAGQAVVYGTDPDAPVLDSLLASTARPPWVRPLRREGRLLIDGGAVSNLPIEAALDQDAAEIIALDVADPHSGGQGRGLGSFLLRLLCTVEQRQAHLEKRLAAALGVPVYHVRLRPDAPLALWDFSQAEALFKAGYAGMGRYLEDHPQLVRS